MLGGGGGALADITRLNAGAALYVAGRADSLAAGIAAASEVQASGSAAAKLAELVGWNGWDDGGGGD